MTLPDAAYLVLASRVAPALDGGFAVAVPWRVRQLVDAGAQHPLLLTLDAADPATHTQWRDELAVHRMDAAAWRNLFDDAQADPAWLFAAGVPGAADPAVEYRQVRDAAGRPLVDLPVIPNNPAWHLTTAPVVVHAPGGDRVLPGFGGLYRAWLDHIVAQQRADDPERMVVVICEARQVGELLVGWGDAHTRLVHTVHNSHLPAPYDDPDASLAPPWARWLEHVHDFDAVLWPTRAQRDDVAARFGEDDGFSVVPNPIELGDEPAAAASRSAARVVMVGRLAAQKRVDLAIDAFVRVHAEMPSATLDVYGDGPLRETLQSLIDERGLGAVVTLRGRVTPAERDAAYEQATLMLSTAAFEGQGLSIAEALARGLPVVAFDAKYGPREVIGDGGVLIEPGDVDALADAVVALLRDDSWRARLSAAARDAARRFDPAAIRPALVEAMEAAVRHPSRRATDGPTRRAPQD
ncbi:glycosyltransferase [Microbacterium horticulturae]|uniref:D-inositol 3-phosphate glycosyltransferase n=1 Tax=Microbacterium horticulturae TaxID=3028316 RepID=A0ABY8BVA1_9MICO|nr:glycosyltransferase [Microbacterium sp. KACC 23027]WEG08099.1 glycosyltransferase [Microbacterium sp. KACC 23027]